MVRSPLLCPISVGREAPRRLLLDRMERAAAGQGSVLLLGGDAGVGKSRLIRELKHEATARRIRVVEGRCSSAESSVPYAPLMDALRFRLARGEGAAVARMLGPLSGVLAPLFPQLEHEPAGGEVTYSERPFDLIFRVLERLAAEDPMLLVLEDVHWADQTSLELLHHLAHRAQRVRMLLVATYRSDELHAAHPLRRLLAALGRDRVGEQVLIEPLRRDETAEMLRRMLGAEPDPAFVAAIWRRTEGNPLFVEELMSALAEEGTLRPTLATAEALGRVRLPATVSEAVLARVHALGASALEVLSAAAVAGRSVEFDVLREVLGLSEESLLAVLEQLVSHQLLREEHAGAGECYAFPHALMQEALYDSVISRRRRLLHRRVAESLENRPARRTPTRLDELAYHFRLGGDHERAYEYARLAGDEAARLRAWDDAEAHYERALAALEELGDHGPRAAELLERLADVAWRQGRSASGRQYAEEALRLRRAMGPPECTARLLRRLAAFRMEQHDAAGASDDLREALRLLSEHPDSPELGPLYDDLGRISIARGDLRGAEELLLRGLALAGRDANGAEEVLALVGLGEVGVLGAHIDAGVARLDVALEVLREGWLPFERAAQVYATGVRALVLAHEYGRALAWADDARTLCREQAVTGLDALFGAYRAAVTAMTSGAAEAVREAEEAVDTLRRTGRAELRDALRVLGFVHRLRGELEPARRAYGEALSLGERPAAVGLALVTLAEGHAGEAADALEAALRAVPASSALLRHRILPHVAEALVASGRLARAVELVDAELPPRDPRAGGVEARYAAGIVRRAEGRLDESRIALEEAAAGWSALGNRTECARARVALLETLVDDHHPDATALGRTLLDELALLGLATERERVRRALRRAGVRTRAPARVTPLPEAAGGAAAERLTAREEAVLREVAKGRTNREIARELGIAEKTVSVHVSHILAKLGCRTRTQAARHVSA